MTGKCSGCGKTVVSVNGHALKINMPDGKSTKGITYQCPSCQTVLGCQVDPIFLKAGIVSEVVRAVQSR